MGMDNPWINMSDFASTKHINHNTRGEQARGRRAAGAGETGQNAQQSSWPKQSCQCEAAGMGRTDSMGKLLALRWAIRCEPRRGRATWGRKPGARPRRGWMELGLGALPLRTGPARAEVRGRSGRREQSRGERRGGTWWPGRAEGRLRSVRREIDPSAGF